MYKADGFSWCLPTWSCDAGDCNSYLRVRVSNGAFRHRYCYWLTNCTMCVEHILWHAEALHLCFVGIGHIGPLDDCR